MTLMEGHIVSAGIAILFLSATLFGREKGLRVQVTNPSAFERQSETIAVGSAVVKKHVPPVDSLTTLVIDEKTGDELLTQWTEHELLFQAGFKAKETRRFIIRNGTPRSGKPKSLVDGRFVEPRQDYAWENDHIAFRVYGPALAAESDNGIDVWTKRVRYLIVEKWYGANEGNKSGKDTYHEDHGEGADFFTVGRSLGCGGSGIWYDNRVYQPGVFSSYKTIDNGPIRVAFELTYGKWNIEGRKLTEVKRISLDAGQNLNRIDVTFSGSVPNNALQIACGVVKRNNTTMRRDEKHGWVGLWGQTNDDPVNGSLGTGVVLTKSSYVKMSEDKDQYLIIGRAKTGKAFTYYAGAGWTRSGDFSSIDDWSNYLDQCAQKLRAPLKVSIGAQGK